MAMYKIAEPHMVQCPYNRSHIVSSLRIQKHVVKCQKNYPDSKLVSCVYNFSHKVKPEDILSHYEVCPFKSTINISDFEEASASFDPATRIVNPNKICNLPTKSKVFLPSWDSNLSLSSDSFDYRSDSLAFDSDSFVTDQCSDEEDEIKPLPLPKTPSKAFVYQSPNEECKEDPLPLPKTPSKAFLPMCSTPSSSSLKSFGRGKSILMKETPKSNTRPNVVVESEEERKSRKTSSSDGKKPTSSEFEILGDNSLDSRQNDFSPSSSPEFWDHDSLL